MKTMAKCSLVILLVFSANLLWAQGSPSFKVVVNSSNSIRSISKTALSKILLKKTTKWKDGREIKPVDLKVGNPVRGKLSIEVHKRPIGAIRHYWNQRVFSGKSMPPPEKKSDAEVMAYVRKHSGAIGYVSGGAALSGVKAIGVTN